MRLVIIVVVSFTFFGHFENGSIHFDQTWHDGRQGHPKKHHIGQSPEKVPRTSTESLEVPKLDISMAYCAAV